MNVRPSSRGSALLIVLWALAMMSLTIIGLVELVHHDLDETTALVKYSRAYQLAQSGLAIGMHPLIKHGDPMLIQTIAPGESFEVHLRSEGARLNINNLLRNSQWQVLHDLFKIWGLHEADAVNITDAFADWAYPKPGNDAGPPSSAATLSFANPTPAPTPANQPGQNGQATAPAPQVFRQFQSVDEMLLIPGMDIVAAAKPDWQNYFTIWSSGPLDMNEAPVELIMAVCGVGEVQAERFVNTRLGPDGKPDTEDDVVFTELEQVRQLLGMSGYNFTAISNRLSISDPVVRIESTGIIGSYRRKITVVTPQNVAPPIFYLWQEQ